MWGEIKKKGIVAWVTNGEVRGVFTIPDGTVGLTAERFVNMLQWLYDEFIKDASEHIDIFHSKDNEVMQAFIVRNISRALSYVNHVCSLELILVRLYKETIEKLKVIDPQIAMNESAMEARNKEVEDCFIFRNKVSAHTVYGSPRDEDNIAMHFQSLIALLATSYGPDGRADGFALGGAISINLGDQAPSTKLPQIGLKDLHPKMLAHIKSWETMLTDPCMVAREKVPIKIGDTNYKIE